MILGHEACRACNWKNVFRADDGDPQPQLIASIKCGYTCPACRTDQAGIRMVLASPVPYGLLFDEEPTQPAVLEPQRKGSAMTVTQHLRAFARWWSPREEDTREAILVVSAFWLCLALIELALQNWGTGLDIVAVYWFCTKFFLLWRSVANLGLIIAAFAFDKGAARGNLANGWRKAAQEPLFPLLRKYQKRRRQQRLSARWLRSRGYSRRKAAKLARTYG